MSLLNDVGTLLLGTRRRTGRRRNTGQVVHVRRTDGLRERIARNTRLALRAWLSGALNAAALEALVNAENDVVGDVRLKVRDVLDTEATEGGADNVRGKTEEALANLVDTGVLAVEA